MEQKRITPAKAIVMVIFALMIFMIVTSDYETLIPVLDGWERGGYELSDVLPTFGAMFCHGVHVLGFIMILVSACLPKPRILAMVGCLVAAIGFVLSGLNYLTDPMLLEYNFVDFLNYCIMPFIIDQLWAFALVCTAVLVWVPKKVVKFLCFLPVVVLLLSVGCMWMNEFAYVMEYFSEHFNMTWILMITNYYTIGNHLLMAIMMMIGLAALCNAAALPGNKKAPVTAVVGEEVAA